MSGNLADQLVGKLTEPEKEAINQWGIDETGFPWPNPVNADSVVARIYSRYGENNIYMLGDDIYINHEKMFPRSSSVLAVCGKPKIIMWVTDDQDYDEFWKQVKRTINTEWSLIVARLKEITPQYDRKYIRIINNLVWGKDESDILFK